MDPFKKIGTKGDSDLVDKRRYQRLVGKLIYLSHTRPDISFATSTVIQFMKKSRSRVHDSEVLEDISWQRSILQERNQQGK